MSCWGGPALPSCVLASCAEWDAAGAVAVVPTSWGLGVPFEAREERGLLRLPLRADRHTSLQCTAQLPLQVGTSK
eukprot:scaffold67513_cov22-Tisochrysis_lutea.AAC.1